jgi:hypothetical protein
MIMAFSAVFLDRIDMLAGTIAQSPAAGPLTRENAES